MGLVRLKKSNSYCISIFASTLSPAYYRDSIKVSQMNNRDGGGMFDS